MERGAAAEDIRHFPSGSITSVSPATASTAHIVGREILVHVIVAPIAHAEALGVELASFAIPSCGYAIRIIAICICFMIRLGADGTYIELPIAPCIRGFGVCIPVTPPLVLPIDHHKASGAVAPAANLIPSCASNFLVFASKFTPLLSGG